MTTSNSLPDSSNWKQLYLSSESRWKDLERIRAFAIPIFLAAFLVLMYVVVGYVLFHMEGWVPENLNQFTSVLYVVRTILVILAPVIVIALELIFIFKQAATFMRSFYQPAEYEKLGPLLRRRLLGVLPVPPPLDTIFKYPSIVIQKPSSVPETHWACWLGGPANLVIFDGIAVYLERGNQFSRVVGPGLQMAFLERHERIKEVVDLRPQMKAVTVKPWTKDGVQINLTIRVECQIDASAEAIAQSSKLRFPFDPLAVKTAVESMTVKVDYKGEFYEVSWLEGAWGTITGTVNTYVACHSLDELFFAPQSGKNMNSMQAENGTAEQIEQILSFKIKEELERAKAKLAQNGVKVLAIQIISIEPPKEVQELREKYWENAKQWIAARNNNHAEADRVRIQEQARAEAQKTMLSAIAKKLKSIDRNNLTESLILSLSGILDEGLDDPIVRPLIAKESFAVLERVRSVIKKLPGGESPVPTLMEHDLAQAHPQVAEPSSISQKHRLHVFLCHASADKPTVRLLYQQLRSEDWIDPWLDVEKLLPGVDWDLEIRKAVKTADVVIVFLSRGSVTKEGYVQKEIKQALDIAGEKPEGTIFIIPLRLDTCDVPARLSALQWVNYSDEGSYQRLLLALRMRAQALGI